MTPIFWASAAVTGVSTVAYYYVLPRKTKLRAGLSFGMGINAGAMFFNLVSRPPNLMGAGINLMTMCSLHYQITRNPSET
jgi:hypothetical protein